MAEVRLEPAGGGHIDKTGKLVILGSSGYVRDGKEKFGFIDKSGKIVVDFQYDWAEQFFDGLAMVSKDGKHGYVNTAGEVDIPLQFDGADHFAEGLAAVASGDRWGFIDTR